MAEAMITPEQLAALKEAAEKAFAAAAAFAASTDAEQSIEYERLMWASHNAHKAFLNDASPDGVRSLIAEVERLREALTMVRDECKAALPSPDQRQPLGLTDVHEIKLRLIEGCALAALATP